MVNIYRYDFDRNFMAHLIDFSNAHEKLDRKEFKREWIKWRNANDKLVQDEYMRLTTLGYDGDFELKMFSTVRYYLNRRSQQKEPKPRKPTVTINKEMLAAMDKYLKTCLLTQNYTPFESFKSFCIDARHTHILELVCNKLLLLSKMTTNEIMSKLRQTYNNRYYKQKKILETNNNIEIEIEIDDIQLQRRRTNNF